MIQVVRDYFVSLGYKCSIAGYKNEIFYDREFQILLSDRYIHIKIVNDKLRVYYDIIGDRKIYPLKWFELSDPDCFAKIVEYMYGDPFIKGLS